MTELQWTPSQIGSLTPTQLLALLNKRDPRVRVYSGEAITEFLRRQAEERKAWERSYWVSD
jgi:hypothetical protein